jgi:hypothetical protein
MQLKLCGCRDKDASGFTGSGDDIIGVVCDNMPHEFEDATVTASGNLHNPRSSGPEADIDACASFDARHRGFGLWRANATPASVSTIASASQMPSGSPSMTAAAMTPMIGTESVPMAAVTAGNLCKAANHARQQMPIGPNTM